MMKPASTSTSIINVQCKYLILQYSKRSSEKDEIDLQPTDIQNHFNLLNAMCTVASCSDHLLCSISFDNDTIIPTYNETLFDVKQCHPQTLLMIDEYSTAKHYIEFYLKFHRIHIANITNPASLRNHFEHINVENLMREKSYYFLLKPNPSWSGDIEKLGPRPCQMKLLKNKEEKQDNSTSSDSSSNEDYQYNSAEYRD
jgi:hypothetical protein